MEIPTGIVVPLADVGALREELVRAHPDLRIVATNGCFDLLHVGHLRYLAEARSRGDFLWVGINGDKAVRALKGASRPINTASDRAEILAALRIVDAVTVFPDVRATEFLAAVRPHLYVKGGDYTVGTLDAEERGALEKAGSAIEIMPLVPGKSTTGTIARMNAS